MDSKKLTLSLTKLQNSLLSPILINDALIDIIEVNVADTGKATICAPHTHTWFEMNYTTKNPMWTTIDNETFEINEGEFFLIPPGIEHSHTYDPNSPNTCIVLRWMINKNPQAVENKLDGFFVNLNRLNKLKPQAIKDNYKIFQHFEQIFEEAADSYFCVNLQLLLVKIMTTLVELTTDRTITIFNKDKHKTSLVRKVEVMLNDNAVKELTVHSIARSLHMSYGHLSRIYKKEAGITILERLNKIRLEKATELLLNTDYSIKEIAFKAGFSSQFYFSRLFHERMGITPSDFRVRGLDKTNDKVYYP